MMMIISIIFCVSLSISALVLVTWLVPIIAVLPLYFVLGKLILVIVYLPIYLHCIIFYKGRVKIKGLDRYLLKNIFLASGPLLKKKT